MINSKVKGYTIGAIAAASYGLNPMFALPLYQEGMTPDSVLFFRYMLAIPIMGILLAYRRGLKEFEIRKKECFQFFGIGVLMALSSLFFILELYLYGCWNSIYPTLHISDNGRSDDGNRIL